MTFWPTSHRLPSVALHWADTQWHCSVCWRNIYTWQKHSWPSNLRDAHNNSEQNTRTAVLEMDQHFRSESFKCSVKFNSELMNAVKCYEFEKHLTKHAGQMLFVSINVQSEITFVFQKRISRQKNTFF